MESPSSAFSQLRVRLLDLSRCTAPVPGPFACINLQEPAHEAFHCYGIK
jgi:hypothetical protein